MNYLNQTQRDDIGGSKPSWSLNALAGDTFEGTHM